MIDFIIIYLESKKNVHFTDKIQSLTHFPFLVNSLKANVENVILYCTRKMKYTSFVFLDALKDYQYIQSQCKR